MLSQYLVTTIDTRYIFNRTWTEFLKVSFALSVPALQFLLKAAVVSCREATCDLSNRPRDTNTAEEN